MFKLISLIRDKFHQDDIALYELPFPGFVMDTRSSPVEVRYELDVRNDQNRAAWSKRWRTLAFEQGRYGAQAVEESVGARRAVVNPQRVVAAVEKPAAVAGKVLQLKGALAA